MSIYEKVSVAAEAGNKADLYELLNGVEEKTERAKFLRHAVRCVAFKGNRTLANDLLNDMQVDIRDILHGAVKGNQRQYVHDILSEHNNLIPIAYYCAVRFGRKDYNNHLNIYGSRRSKYDGFARELDAKWKTDFNQVAHYAASKKDVDVLEDLLDSDFKIDLDKLVECVVGPAYDPEFAEDFRLFCEIPANLMAEKALAAGNADYLVILEPTLFQEEAERADRMQQRMNLVEQLTLQEKCSPAPTKSGSESKEFQFFRSPFIPITQVKVPNSSSSPDQPLSL